MTTKREFRDVLFERLIEGDIAPSLLGEDDHVHQAAVNRGLKEGWLCLWPDCCDGAEPDFGCGTRYGCALVPR